MLPVRCRHHLSVGVQKGEAVYVSQPFLFQVTLHKHGKKLLECLLTFADDNHIHRPGTVGLMMQIALRTAGRVCAADHDDGTVTVCQLG
jgi:hypothetical protein